MRPVRPRAVAPRRAMSQIAPANRMATSPARPDAGTRRYPQVRLVSETRLMWDMPITVAIVEPRAVAGLAAAPGLSIARVFDYFEHVDEVFSTYRPDSEISRINQGALAPADAGLEMRSVFGLAQEMRWATNGYFDIERDGKIDPLGLVKGWAISNAAAMLRDAGCENFYVEAGGDFQAVGRNAEGRPWRVGIRNPFDVAQIVKVLAVTDRGVATSGTYIRGEHIYNPVTGGMPDPEIVSITVVGPDIYEADCFATAAFAMGRKGIAFIESLEGFEGYMIDRGRLATFTSGFDAYVDHEEGRP